MNDHQYSNLYIRENINSYVKYIKIINTIIDKSMPNSNIADIINNYKIETSQIKPIIYSLLVDKWKYKVRSINLLEKINNPLYLIKEVSRWNNVDIVIKYESLQVLVFNPKNLDSKSILEIMQPNELVTVYIGNKNNISEELIDIAMDNIFRIIQNDKVKQNKKLVFSSSETKIENSQTKHNNPFPLLYIPVSNELFHNGNVEAWKRIIASYQRKYEDARVVIFYEGEEILNLNSLFKWGKVKYGSVIHFTVLSKERKDLSKLCKYLKEGASPYFDKFLSGAPNSILDLF